MLSALIPFANIHNRTILMHILSSSFHGTGLSISASLDAFLLHLSALKESSRMTSDADLFANNTKVSEQNPRRHQNTVRCRAQLLQAFASLASCYSCVNYVYSFVGMAVVHAVRPCGAKCKRSAFLAC